MGVSSIRVLLFREDSMACDPVLMKPSTDRKLDAIILGVCPQLEQKIGIGT